MPTFILVGLILFPSLVSLPSLTAGLEYSSINVQLLLLYIYLFCINLIDSGGFTAPKLLLIFSCFPYLCPYKKVPASFLHFTIPATMLSISNSDSPSKYVIPKACPQSCMPSTAYLASSEPWQLLLFLSN